MRTHLYEGAVLAYITIMKWFYLALLLFISFSADHAFAQNKMLRNLEQLDKAMSYKDRPKGEWRKCKSDSDCEIFHFGCYGVVSINKESRKAAERYYYERLHQDPRVMNCVNITDSEYTGEIISRCRAGHCGAWQHLKCLDPPECTMKYEEECTYEERTHLDEDEDGFYVLNEQPFFALYDEMCVEKCKTHYVERLKMFEKYDLEHIVMDCKFNGETVLKDDKKYEHDQEE